MTIVTETDEIPGADDLEAPVSVSDAPRVPTTYEKMLRTKLANASKRATESDARATTAEAKLAAEVARLTEESLASNTKLASEVKSAADLRVIRAEIKTAAIKSGLRDPSDISLFDLSKLTLDDKGDVVIPDGLFEGFKAAKPYLFSDAKDGPATGFTSNPGAPPPARTGSKSAKDMTPDEYRASLKAMGIKL
jgi:hypothetical protein